jgi:nitrogen fixation/metabolism regulation signal transduction histidine kinase
MGDKTKKFERKHFFINRRLQGRYMLTFLIPMLIMLVFMLFTLYYASQSVVNNTTSTIKQGIQDKETAFLQDNQSPSVESYRLLFGDIKSFIRDYSRDTAYRRVLLSSLLMVFGTGILLVMIQIVLLTIYFSHKVAGPIYRFERMCHNIIEGDYSGGVSLRKGDEMQTLASLFNEVIGKTRERMTALRDADDEEKKKVIASKLKF